jgi:hypothetical protein
VTPAGDEDPEEDSVGDLYSDEYGDNGSSSEGEGLSVFSEDTVVPGSRAVLAGQDRDPRNLLRAGLENPPAKSTEVSSHSRAGIPFDTKGIADVSGCWRRDQCNEC